jgi:hypothetical protein
MAVRTAPAPIQSGSTAAPSSQLGPPLSCGMEQFNNRDPVGEEIIGNGHTQRARVLDGTMQVDRVRTSRR